MRKHPEEDEMKVAVCGEGANLAVVHWLACELPIQFQGEIEFLSPDKEKISGCKLLLLYTKDSSLLERVSKMNLMGKPQIIVVSTNGIAEVANKLGFRFMDPKLIGDFRRNHLPSFMQLK